MALDNLNLQMVMENLRSQPGLISALSGNGYGNPAFQELSKELAYVVQNMAGGNQRPNALGIDMIQNENDAEIGNQEKKAPFKRAATHVAIAYFIYLKSVMI
jgi:hypothetical protein